MEFTQENFEKLLKVGEENENYKKSLKEERERRKQAQEEVHNVKGSLEELQSFKKELEEKEAKKKGKYEELLSEKDKQLEELTGKLTSVETKATKYDEFLNKNLEDKMSKIPEEKKEFITKVLSGKDHEEQLSLLDGFILDYSKPTDFKVKPKDDGTEAKDTSKEEEAKSKGDIIGMISNAPKLNTED